MAPPEARDDARREPPTVTGARVPSEVIGEEDEYEWLPVGRRSRGWFNAAVLVVGATALTWFAFRADLASPSGDDALCFAIWFLIAAVQIVPRALYGVAGWERAGVVEGDTLLIERIILGFPFRSRRCRRARVEFDPPDPSGCAAGYLSGQDDPSLYTFNSGPLLVEYEDGAARFGEGLRYEPERLRGIADRLNARLGVSLRDLVEER